MKTKLPISISLTIIMLAILICAPGNGFGQASIVNYTFSTAKPITPTDMSTGTTPLIAGASDNVASAVTNIGFTFQFMGVPYTQFSVNSNGQMLLGNTVVASTGVASAQILAPYIAPFGSNNYILSTGKVHYKLVGTSPNQVLIVEWKDLSINNVTTGIGSLVQALLYEGSGKIEFKYGTINSNAAPTTTTFGIFLATDRAASTDKYILTGMATAANGYPAVLTTMTSANISALSSRLYTFTPPALVPAAPASLTFTGVTQSGMTLNWPDVTGESKYDIYRSDDGGTNYVKIASTVANAITYAATVLVPGTTYFWRVIAVNEAQSSAYIQASQATNASGAITSTATGGLWNTPATWTGGVVPAAFDNVTIANGATVTINANVSCANLTVGQGTSGILTFDGTARTFTVNGSVNIATGASFNAGTANITHIVKIGGSLNNDPYIGNLTVNGSLDFYVGALNGKANISFFGLTNAIISGTKGTVNFNTGNILNKGLVTATATVTPPVLDIQRSFTVQGASTSGFLATHTAGVLKIGGTFAGSNPVYATAAYSIPTLGGLWLNNPNFTILGLTGNATNNGLLKISNGIFNFGTATGNWMTAPAAGSVFIFEGGTTNIAGRIDLAGTSVCTLIVSGSAVINVTTVGTGSNTRGFGFASPSNTVSITGGTINLVQAAATGYHVNGLNPIVSGATLNVGTAATTTNFIFMVSGIVPNLVIDNNLNTKTLWMSGTSIINGTTTVTAGSTLDLRNFSTTITTFRSTITNNGLITATGNSAVLGSPSTLIFQGSVPQSLGGNISFLNNSIGLLVIDNPAGVTIVPSMSLGGLTLTSGTLTCGGILSLGNGGTTGFNFTNTNGSFSVPPTINYGSGIKNFTYNGTIPQTPGIELPAIVAAGTLIINNPAGVVLNAPLSIQKLTLTSGALTTTSANLLTVTGASNGDIVRTSGYVRGPLVHRIQASLTTGFTYFWPVGKSAYTPFELVNPTTTAGGTVDIQVEVFDANSGGTPGTGMGSLNTDRYWESSITAGAANFTNTTVRVTDASVIPAGKVLAGSATLNGIYDLVGNTIVGSAIQSNTLTALNFFAIGNMSCINPTVSGTIGADQNSCGSFDPALITSTLPASGQTGTLEYKWQYSVAPFTTWIDIAASNTATYDPTTLTVTTQYQRLARVNCKIDWVGAAVSNLVTMTVNPIPTVLITNPAPFTFPASVDLTVPNIKSGSTAGLDYSYWRDAAATIPLPTPTSVTGGTYFIKGTVPVAGCSDSKPVIVSGVISYWHLDEATGNTYVDITGTNNGTGNPSPTSGIGQVNGAQQFNGTTTKIEVPASPTFDFAAKANFSVEFWYKGINAPAETQIAVGRFILDGGAKYWYVQFSPGSGTIVFNIVGGGVAATAYASPIFDGNWHHVAATRNGTTGESKLFVDGSLKGSATQSLTVDFSSPTSKLEIGSFLNRYLLEGGLDEVAIHNVELSPAEILQHYTNGLHGFDYYASYSPVVTTTAPLSGIVSQLYTYDVNADGYPVPIYSLTTSPAGMTIDPTTGLIQWTPSAGGNFNVTVIASNGVNPASSQSFVIAIPVPPVIPAGLVAYWKLDEAAGNTYIDFAGTNNGTGTPSPTAALGQVNGSQLFNGTSTKIEVPASPTFDFAANANFSVEFWYKGTNAPTETQIAVGRFILDGGAKYWYVQFSPGSGTIVFNIVGGGVAATAYASPIFDGNWHHVAATRNGTTGESKLFVDGSLKGSATQSLTVDFSSPTSKLEIGSFLNRYLLEGGLDEVAIHNVELSPAEILRHYTNGLHGVGYYSNYAPVITSTSITNGSVGSVYSYDVNADGYPSPITYSLTTSPVGMTIDPTTGLIQWTPVAAGDVNVTVVASNGVNSTSSQSFVISVTLAALKSANINTRLDNTDNPVTKLAAFAIRNIEIRVVGEVSNDAVATLYDIQGRAVLIKNLDEGNLNVISTANIKMGIYILSVKDKGKLNRFKLMIRE